MPAFLSFVTLVLLADVVGGDRVDKDKIIGAACVYVLLGLTFAQLLLLVHSLSPLSVIERTSPSNGEGTTTMFADHLYFSFVTLSTLGYGDLAPRGLVARLVTSTEAIVGQLYLAVRMARLIGLHISRSYACAAGSPRGHDD